MPRLTHLCGLGSTAQLLALGIAQSALFNELKRTSSERKVKRWKKKKRKTAVILIAE